jgi:RNA polymerase sigma-70 factor (ECF subfamily)
MNLTKSECRIGTKTSITEASAPGLSEPEVIRRAQNGDVGAFEYLYNSHSRHVYRVCLRMLKNTADAEDVTQQVFLRLFRKIGTFRGDSGFSTWLHRVAVNTVLMHLRQRRPAEILTDSLDDEGMDGDDPHEFGCADPSMLGAIDRLNLKRAIRQLPSGCKRLFLLHDVMGFKHREIAGLMGCSIMGSKSQLHRARKRLRWLLQGKKEGTELDAAYA